MTITLLQARAAYNLPEELSEEAELFTAGQQPMFKSARDYFIKGDEVLTGTLWDLCVRNNLYLLQQKTQK